MMLKVFTPPEQAIFYKSELLSTNLHPSLLLNIYRLTTGYAIFSTKTSCKQLSSRGEMITEFSPKLHGLLSFSIFHLRGFQVDASGQNNQCVHWIFLSPPPVVCWCADSLCIKWLQHRWWLPLPPPCSLFCWVLRKENVYNYDNHSLLFNWVSSEAGYEMYVWIEMWESTARL